MYKGNGASVLFLLQASIAGAVQAASSEQEKCQK